MKTLERIRNRAASMRESFVRLVHSPPAGCADGRYSMVLPVHEDDPASAPSPELLDACLAAIAAARRTDLADVSARMKAGPRWPDYWPGEHYRLLAGLVLATKPRNVIEIGTFTGLSALALRKYLAADGVITTFDIAPWDSFRDTCFVRADFEDGRLVQQLGDLSDPDVVRRHEPLLAGADLMFVDAPKDGVFEPKFLRNLERIAFRKPPLIVWDDIRLWNMLSVWRGISRPKLDLTSFGHWSGTGVVRWEARGP